MKSKTKKSFFIESFLILITLAIFLIAVVPNSFDSMNNIDKKEFKSYAKLMFKKAKEVYKSEIDDGKKVGYKGSKFKWVDYDTYAIKISSLDSKQKKYKGCVLINVGKTNNLSIYLYNGKLMYDGILESGLNAKDIPSRDIIKPKNDDVVIKNIMTYQKT